MFPSSTLRKDQTILRDDIQAYRSSTLRKNGQKPIFRPTSPTIKPNPLSAFDQSSIMLDPLPQPVATSTTSAAHRQHQLLRELGALDPALLQPSAVNPSRHQRIQEIRTRTKVNTLKRDLSHSRVLKEFGFRYERRFHPKKWTLLASLVGLIKHEMFRFCPSLDRCFKRVLFRSSQYTTHQQYPLQRVALQQLLVVVYNNYAGNGGGNGGRGGDEDGGGTASVVYQDGKDRGKTKREGTFYVFILGN